MAIEHSRLTNRRFPSTQSCNRPGCNARRDRRILILGESVTWGCVGSANPVQTEDGYLPRLRDALPDYEIRALTYFGAGVADWDPTSPTFQGQSLDFPDEFPFGLLEYQGRDVMNMWRLLGVPHHLDFQPTYTLVFMGFGDGAFRSLRTPPLAALTGSQWQAGLSRICEAVIALNSIPVVCFNTPGASGNPGIDAFTFAYRDAIPRVCDGERILAGPDTFAIYDRTAHFVGTDNIHPNAAGHAAVASALASYFTELAACTWRPWGVE